MDKIEHVIEHEGVNATTTIKVLKTTLHDGNMFHLAIQTERYSSGRSMYSADEAFTISLPESHLKTLHTVLGKALLFLEAK